MTNKRGKEHKDSISAAQDRFVKDFSDAVERGEAALFAGAGMSAGAGFVDWRGLLRDVAEGLGLRVEQESDLIGLAQWEHNERGTRNKLNQAILDKLGRDLAAPTESHRIVARLPIDTIWTTNYDTLIEDSLRAAGRKPAVKWKRSDMTTSPRGTDAFVYKMHGHVDDAESAVITKDDYERYETTRRVFVDKLEGDLVSKTFLFIGFSFTDPNIDYILARVRRALYPDSPRHHFCLMKVPSVAAKKGIAKADAEYEARRHALRVSDLKRHGIEAIPVREYDEIPKLLEAVSRRAHRRGVFVSGAAAEAGAFGEVLLRDLSRRLGEAIIDRGYNLVSGFGLGIGEDVVVGALRALYGRPRGDDVDRVVVRPFPTPRSGESRAAVYTSHREDLIARSRVVVVLAGNRLAAGGGVELSPGVFEEVEIARRLGRVVIPIGATGYVASELWEKMDGAGLLKKGKVAQAFATLGKAGLGSKEYIGAMFDIIADTDASL
jgi:hypothetical protein